MKRILALLLAAIACQCLAGCAPAEDVPTKVYVDRQGTDAIYRSLSVMKRDSGYVIEMEIYRLGYFSGTAVEDKGVLVYSDDLLDMKGIVRFDAGGAVFEMTESASPLAEVGKNGCFLSGRGLLRQMLL